ncbi:MAG: hypothetical protein HY288_17750 [Planctomycetia bacterium]|nr:hypothetical protein [Planctomycetia bacterium]
MTSLDRAFIKAFAETGSPVPVGEHRTERTAQTSRATADVATLDSSRGSVRVAKETILASPEIPRSRPRAAVAPLSTFAPPSRPHESFRALLEVDHLTWPEACDALLVRARGDWDRFAERLSRQIAQGKKCIALTSCQRGEGRTSVALATARLLGARGLRVVVVDADFERPNLADSCGISAQAGWGEVLTGELSLGEALIAAAEDGVTLLPWRGPSMRAARRSNTLPIATSFSMLRDHYDLVLLDTMPLDRPSAISELANLGESIRLDAVYVIFDARSTSSESLASARATLCHSGLHVEGLIENFGPAAAPAKIAQRELTPAVLIPARRGSQPTD